MSKKFIQMTSGWIPVSILVLLAIAFVAGQARATVDDEGGASATPAPVVLGGSEFRPRPVEATGPVIVGPVLHPLSTFRPRLEPPKFGTGSDEPWADAPSL